MTDRQNRTKRVFDFTAAAFGMVVLAPLMGAAVIAARRSTGLSGLFRQTRVGLNGRTFEVLKVRTMRNVAGHTSTVTADGDPRITPLGRLLRKTKVDELPQLWNVLRGDMSLVGPRPDVPAQLDLLNDTDRTALLSMRPGVTGPASLKYRDEEAMLAASADPQRLNDEVLWPDKVRINLEYARRWTLLTDLRLIAATVLPGGRAANDSPEAPAFEDRPVTILMTPTLPRKAA